MEILRTPDERFLRLPGWSFEPRYVDVGGLRVHYVDEGPREAAPVLLLHGEPSWSFLWRDVIRPLAAAGHRCVAPDLVGFGRSDKPASRADHSYARHVAWMGSFVAALGLERVTLVCHDWGGLIGLRLAVAEEHTRRFARVVAANTFLPTGDQRPAGAFFAWQRFSQETADFRVGEVIKMGCLRPPPAEVLAAYDAPFPDERYKAGPRALPVLVPSTPDDPEAPANRIAWAALCRFERPFLTAFSDGDPITGGLDAIFQREVPGARGQPHVTIAGASHFLQEERAAELAGAIVGWLGAT